MKNEKTKNLLINILTFTIVTGVLIAGYYVFTKGKGTVIESAVSTSKIAEETASIGADVEATKKDLKALSKDVEGATILFELPEFKNLQNFTVEVPTESLSRINPFVPTAWKLKLISLEGVTRKSSSVVVAPSASTQTVNTGGTSTQTPSSLLGNFSGGI
ncbi:MAG: hypothetical protein Q7K40_00545 [bacterium]|nr:hypothetical protein [bacterium]